MIRTTAALEIARRFPPSNGSEAAWRQVIDPPLTEYLVIAFDRETGEPVAPFIVPAVSAEAALRLSQRKYLDVQMAVPYEFGEGAHKPKICPWGPAISDRKFDRYALTSPPDKSANLEPTDPAILLGQLLARVFGA